MHVLRCHFYLSKPFGLRTALQEQVVRDWTRSKFNLFFLCFVFDSGCCGTGAGRGLQEDGFITLSCARNADDGDDDESDDADDGDNGDRSILVHYARLAHFFFATSSAETDDGHEGANNIF